MTLVAIWKPETGAIQLTADSRLSFGSAGTADVGGKLALLPIQMFDATPEGEEFPPLLLSRMYGIAVFGSAVSAHKVLELLRVVFAGIQVAPGLSHFSLADAADVALSALESVVVPIAAVMERTGLAGLVLVGFCPVVHAQQAFLVSVDETMQGSVEQLTLSAKPLFFGTPSAVDAANAMAGEKHPLTPHRILRRICEDGSHKLVGGTVQYGAVVGTDFAIFGSRDYEIDEDAENADVIRVRYFASGVALSRVSKVIDSKGIVPRYKYVSLFEGDIMNLERKGYRVEYE